MSDRWRVRLAAGVALFGVLCCIAVVPMHAYLSDRADVDDLYVSDLLFGSAWPLVGALIIRSQPRHPVGWVMMIPAFLGPYQVLAHYGAISQLLHEDDPLPLEAPASWVGAWGFVVYFLTIPLLPLVFPDGRFVSPRWRWVGIGVGVVVAVTTLARMLAPLGIDFVAEDTDNPTGIGGADWLRGVMIAGAMSTLLGGTLLGALSVYLRLRRSTGIERMQLQWLVLGIVLLVAALLGSLPFDGTAGELIFSVGLMSPPVCIGVAMLRYRLFDVGFALNRTIVYLVLSAAVVGIYAVIVFGVDAYASDSELGIVVIGVAALLAALGRDVVQAMVDRLLFGHRHDPYAVVSRVGRHVAPAAEPAEALQRLVDALRKALRLPYVGFVGEITDIAVHSGEPVEGWRIIPATALGTPVGELRVGRRAGDPRWTEAEQAAVEEVAGRAGTLAYAAALVTDVQRSRERIVVAREEERRRLRADLHDGVGPVLAGTAHQLDALARKLDKTGEDDLAVRAREIRDRLRGTVADVRSVVHGLRPPVLDQIGLAGALRGLVEAFEVPEATARVDDLGELPAAVEVAGYAIAGEAVTNAVRHSAAARLTLTARRSEGNLLVEVADDGCGVPSRPQAGIGLRSMGERAAEVGGWLDVLPRPGGGTIVRALLPVEVA